MPTLPILLPGIQTGKPVKLVQYVARSGELVKRGDVIAILECEKAEYPFVSKIDGRIEWSLAEGACTHPGVLLATVTPDAPRTERLPLPAGSEVEEHVVPDPATDPPPLSRFRRTSR